jgi:hypothetical protein
MKNLNPARGVGPQLFIDEEWLALHEEEVLEVNLPIVDAHHHLWDRGIPYLVNEYLSDLRCGHSIRGSVYIEAGYAYRVDGDPMFASIGEVEFANGVGAQFASGYFGDVRACSGIVGRVDLRSGACTGPL